MSKSYERPSNTAPRTLKGDIEAIKEKHPIASKLLAGVALSSVALFGGIKAVEHFSGPEFSESTTTYTVEPGDGLQVVVGNIEGIDSIDWRDAVSYVRDMPENESVFENNQLDPGESVTIPESVNR